MRKTLALLAVAAVAFAGSTLIGGSPSGLPSKGKADQVAPATQRLLNEYPGLQVERSGESVHALYGVPMTTGSTPYEAVDRFLDDHRGALGVANLDLRLQRTHSVGRDEKFTVFAYNQRMAGLPVEGGIARILVLNGDAIDRVVYVGAKLAQPPAGGFAEMTLDADTALDTLLATESFGHFDHWHAPELVVFYGEADVQLEEPVRTWKITTERANGAQYEAYTIFVDAATGELVYTRDDIHTVDVDGTTTANVTPGTSPDTGSNPTVNVPLEAQTVSIQGGNSATSAEDGTYTISHGGSGNVTVQANLEGLWIDVFTDQGSRLFASDNVTPPGPASLVFNTAPTEFTTAQANVYHYTVGTHDFIKDRQPQFTALDFAITGNTNLTSSCNAFYSSANQSINFYNEAGGCVNTAYSSVIAHEYGHFIVNRLGLSQGAFGEGFGDLMSLIQYDDPILGRDFRGPGQHVRDPLGSNIQYPCGQAIHTCGMVLGATWYRIRQSFGSKYGSSTGLSMTQDMLTDWAMITIGGIGSDAAHPTTAIEVLTVNDDDGNLNNGTPDFTEICNAFDAHNIPCPALPPVLFTYPDGLPTTLEPNETTTIRVNVTSGQQNPVSGTGTLSYAVNGGSFQTVAMSETQTNEYEGTLPAGVCFDHYDFYFSVGASGGGTISDPTNAPASSYSSDVVTGATVIFTDDFQTNQGWTINNIDLTDGPWQRGVPAGDGSRGDPTSDADGSGQCYLTDNVAGNSDVDGGPTQLTSPDIDMSSGNGTISYSYWFYNDDGDNDALTVEVSNNSGGTWTTAASYSGLLGGWRNDSFVVGDFVTPTANVRVRFSATDNPNDSVTEAAVDAIAVTVFDCDAFDDCNNNGTPDDQDIQSGFSQDCNNNGIPDECDIADGFSEDCNLNGIPDDCDIASGFSEDCNLNGIPDSCDIANGTSQDCNGNSIPDSCDIASGFSEDCNGNGVPDDCDISSGFSEDCNLNGVPDDCDVVNGTVEDCNGNSVPDSCDIESGFSEDANGNGIPDECDGQITFCGAGAANLGCGPLEDLITINGSTGGPSRTLMVDTTTPLSMSIVEPSAEAGDSSDNRTCIYLWFDAPTGSDSVDLPKNLGSMCFGPPLVSTRAAEVILNGIGAPNKLGTHTGPGDPPRIPDGQSLEFITYPSGVGQAGAITIQGFVQDECTQGTKPFSVTNGILVRVLP